MEIEALQQECLACRRCGLCETRTNVVFGQGVTTAEVMFVGEGPGASEDEQGLPFVGKSGQLLDHYLEAVDLSRDKNVYIANIVKCRPPQNRDPLPEESAACMPWLRRQFQIDVYKRQAVQLYDRPQRQPRRVRPALPLEVQPRRGTSPRSVPVSYTHLVRRPGS